MIDLCQGSKGAVDYILKCYPDVREIAAIGCGSSTIPYYYPYAFTENWKNEKIFLVEYTKNLFAENSNCISFVRHVDGEVLYVSDKLSDLLNYNQAKLPLAKKQNFHCILF